MTHDQHHNNDNIAFHFLEHPAADHPGISLLPSKEFLPFESAELAEGQITVALKDDGVNIIGVWGMGGEGKTTLVKEVGRKAKKSKLFGEVVIATVSQNPNIGKLQKGIAESLNLTLINTTDVGRREELCAALEEKQSILIILDDLWRELDLMKIGIPSDELQYKGCKILLTTRFQQVCSDMGSEKVVWLNVLGKDEAWQLFKICAALDDDHTPCEILKVADEIVEECKGLPIALSTLGKALKGAGLHRWREATRSLKSSKWPVFQSVSEDAKNAYKCLKVSYDFLMHEETKKCFLLCCLYPEDHSIPIEELVRHAWGLELFEGKKSIQEARDAVYTAVDDLKACSLLLDDEQAHVKMHDMSWEQGEWPRNENFEHCTAISLMDCYMERTPQELEYPKLQFLSYSGAWDEEKTMMFSSSSFEGMKSLKVLNLVKMKKSLSQNAPQILTNLRCLYLESCELNTYNISSLGNLKKLEILSFYESDIEVLPDEVGEVKSLRLLDLSCCERLKRIPPNVIQRLFQLEELYLGDCKFNFDEWQIEGTDAEGRNASLLELNELPHLTILVLEVSDFEHFPKDFVFPKLHNYSIAIGNNTGELYPSRRCLKLYKTASLHVFQNLFEVEWLELNSIVNCQHHVPSLGLNSLSILKAHNCEDMEYLVDPRNQHVPVTLSNLSVLNIGYMNCFKGLCNGPPPNGFLKKLETLEISSCGKLKSLFPASVSRNLLQLKSLKVAACGMLEQIFEEIGGANDQVLQKLETLDISECGSLKYIFPASVTKNLLQLKNVNIAVCGMLEQICECEGIGGATANDQALQELETLVISGCDSLKSLFPVWITKNLLQFKNIKIATCDMLEQIFEVAVDSNGGVLPKLETLDISGCDKLKYLHTRMEVAVANGEGSSATHIQPMYVLPNLRSLKISDCPKLRPFNTASFQMEV
ncbi:Disease resistance protein [Corchorus olitorius]|uniref:Disease resistance protein n=1 Tax=Corchorus olitorius TaxID=93759 RepID=A0A1R3L4U1_9ROSI|nr:Disease resistance protein [Corchorus olitorius]